VIIRLAIPATADGCWHDSSCDISSSSKNCATSIAESEQIVFAPACWSTAWLPGRSELTDEEKERLAKLGKNGPCDVSALV
jgi:hypothetical protein